jgi:translation initiation factor IF-2
LIIKNGTIKKGMTVAVENSTCSTRIIENFKGETIDEASFSSPVRIVGFDKMPRVGALFKTFQKKREAEEYAENFKEGKKSEPMGVESTKKIIPIILKADVAGSIEAIEKEITKIQNDTAEFKIVGKGIGPISESDIKGVSSGEEAIVIGFNVKADKSAIEMAEKRSITISFFDIIYKMTEWLQTQMEERRPRIETVEITGRAKIIRAFSRTKERQIVGGKVVEGQINLNSTVKIMRREFEIGRGKIINLEKSKTKTSTVEEGSEFGMMIESKIEIVAGDVLESFSITQK